MDHFEKLARAVCESWGLVPEEGTGLYIDGVQQCRWQDEEVLKHVQSFIALTRFAPRYVQALLRESEVEADCEAGLSDLSNREEINRIADAIHVALGWGEADPLKEPHTWRQAQSAAVAAGKAGRLPRRPGATYVATLPDGIGRIISIQVKDGMLMANTESGVDFMVGPMGRR